MFLFLSPLFVNFNAICLECIEDGVIKCIGYYSPFFILDDGVLREESIFYNCAHKILRAFFFCEFSICRGGGGMKGKKKTDGQGALRRQRISRVGDKKKTRADMLKSKIMKVQL